MLLRWYDYPAAYLAADLMITAAFNAPYIGLIVAYGLYDFWTNTYCPWRLKQEYGAE